MDSKPARHVIVAPPTADEIRDQIQRIAESDGFRNSVPIKQLFTYLGQLSIDHPGRPVKEYQLATEALGRGADFDPRIDSMVRVLATRLRSKLAEYYTHQGADDPVIFDLPKGSYVLLVTARGQDDEAATPVATGQTAPLRPTKRFWMLGSIIGLAVLLVAAYFAGRHVADTNVASEELMFWNGFIRNRKPLIIYSNPVFYGTLEDGIQLQKPSQPADVHSIDIFTGTGELAAVQALTKELSLLRYPPDVKRAPLFTWDEAAAHDLIFVGGPAQNAAYTQLPQLEKFTLKTRNEEPFPGQGAVHNQRPTGNELSDYVESKDANYTDKGIVYAIVALVPSSSPTQRVLILAGTNTYGTEAAAQFVCNADMLANLMKQLQVRKGAPIPSFEALLQVQVRGGVPLYSHLVAVYKRSN